MLSARSLSKAYRRRQVVQDVSFEVQAGEIVGLLGPNGAGKTTSFNIVAGLCSADAGSVRLGGDELGTMPLYRRARLGLAYLPQESTVFRGLAARDNLTVVAEGRLPRAEVQTRVDAMLRRFKLEHVADNLGSELSGGERRRLEMARALLFTPRVLLLDEPFAGVDPIAVGEIRTFIRGAKERGMGVLLTDHNVRETLGICDRAYIINAGKILLTGTPAAIVADPVVRRTYLGEDFSL